MSKLFSRATVSGASLSGANLKAALTTLWDALQSIGVTDTNRTTVTASATLTMSQCGIVLVDCTSGSVVLTLPTSGTATDEAEYQVRRIDTTYTSTLTVQRGGSDTIEGSITVPITVGCGGQVNVKIPGGTTNWRVNGRSGGTTLAAREALGVQAANWLDNPDGEIYQRGVVATADDTYMDDRWYALTQTATVTPSQLTSPEDGFAFGVRLTQSQAAAQRMGVAQILEGKRTKKIRGKTMTWGGRFRLSTSANLRFAILAWTGTEDAVTSDVVNDWTSSTYSAGNFFLASNLTVVAVGSVAMTAATTRDVSLTGAIPSNANNVVVFYWTEATAAQNVTLDGWGRRLVEGATLLDYVRRTEDDELRRCQRFFEKSYRQSVAPGTASNTEGIAMDVLNLNTGTSDLTNSVVTMQVCKRSVPTVTLYSPVSGSSGRTRDTIGGSDIVVAAGFIGDMAFSVQTYPLTSRAAQSVQFHWTASADL